MYLILTNLSSRCEAVVVEELFHRLWEDERDGGLLEEVAHADVGATLHQHPGSCLTLL